MFDLNRRYDRSIVALIYIKHVHFSLSYQQVIYPKYDRLGRESPSGYGAQLFIHFRDICELDDKTYVIDCYALIGRYSISYFTMLKMEINIQTINHTDTYWI